MTFGIFGKMLSVDDYKREDGSVDWAAYRKAEVENGDLCYECGGTARLLGGPGHRVLCVSCEQLAQPDREVDHSSRIRCPHCGHVDIIDGDWEDYEVYSEGDHDAVCRECDKTFTIETRVSYTFTSPPRADKEASDEGDANGPVADSAVDGDGSGDV